MGLSSSIQFRDAIQVKEAFNNRGVEAWSISCGKQFLFKGIGSDEFSNYIDLLNSGDSNATYTVQVYEDIDDAKQIKSNMPNDGSFNFKLNEDLQNAYGRLRQIAGASAPNEIVSKLNAMQQQIEDLQTPVADEDDGLGVIGKLLKHPALSGVAPIIVTKVFELLTGTQAATVNGNHNGNANTQIANGSINLVFEKLNKHDPNLHKHLEKLISIAENDPGTFQTILTALDQ